MAHYPDGSPKIPNPIPGSTPSALPLTREEAEKANATSMLRFAFAEALIITAIVVATFALELIPPTIGTALLVVVAVTSVPLLLRIARQNARRLQDATAVTPRTVPAATGSTDGGSAHGFSLPVDDAFTIAGRGTVVTGTVASGQVRGGQSVTLHRGPAALGTYRITGIEAFRKRLDTASAGDTVGLLLAGAQQSDFRRGDDLRG
ncbi:hypothetical protein GCM10010401_15670 [Rarobacter faecitabidus]|uniref:Elongation factor Tu-like protein n=1 Tax=Rarobacter faecitabidus TaxID=13243 RepID=A0A542ZXE8_RARFA|nr:EF-Tu/IF-2/RF-3 family GTPase [Rarobacter faecitabidus]TQL65032.1 elongation factor Tu-like protein [Rarobacter faecitabidus]